MPVGAWTSPLSPAAYAAQTSSWKGKGEKPCAANHARAGAKGSAFAAGTATGMGEFYEAAGNRRDSPENAPRARARTAGRYTAIFTTAGAAAGSFARNASSSAVSRVLAVLRCRSFT